MRVILFGNTLGMALVLFTSVSAGPIKVDRAGLFNDLQTKQGDTGGLTKATYFSMLKGKHSSQVTHLVLKHFTLKEKSLNGKMNTREFTDRIHVPGTYRFGGGGVAMASSSGGEILFPIANYIVDVDEDSDQFEVMVIVGSDPTKEYRYYGKIYNQPSAPTPGSSPPVDAIEIDEGFGLYVSKWFDEPNHASTYPAVGATTKWLVVWEGTRVPPAMNFTYTVSDVLRYYPHTSNLFFQP